MSKTQKLLRDNSELGLEERVGRRQSRMRTTKALASNGMWTRDIRGRLNIEDKGSDLILMPSGKCHKLLFVHNQYAKSLP